MSIFWMRGMRVWLVVVAAVLGVVVALGAEGGGESVARLLGADRATVVGALGKPASSLRRGDKETLIFGEGLRVDLVDGRVIAVTEPGGDTLVASDGTRYVGTEQGKVVRAKAATSAGAKPRTADVGNTGAPGNGSAAVPAPAPQTPEVATPTSPAGAAAKPGGPAGIDFSDDEVRTIEHGPSPQEAMEHLGLSEPVDTPRWAKALGGILELLARFGVVVFVLRIAMGQVGMSYFWPDLLKVAASYAVVREGLHGLAAFGGLWEVMTLFRLDDALSLIALCVFLVRFKVVTQGITALKVAIATKVVTYIVMMAVAVVISFGMLALR